jgi:nicotinate-nucleotide--dimethylbenzimidazole phosphoribosyltransferase
MNMTSIIERILPLDQPAMQKARQRQDDLTKPRGSLGRLESLSIQIAGITGSLLPKIGRKSVIVMAGDHGVVAEGVSAYPQEVTAQMVMNFLRGGAAINVLAKHAGANVMVVDMGMVIDLPALPGLLVRKIGHGTGNISQEPAMTRQQALAGIQAGVDLVEDELKQGLSLVATGDMGIGNTTPSAAIASALTSLPAHQFVGRGTGIDDNGLNRKILAIERALAINQPDPLDGLDVMAKVGGFEIAGLTGVILGAAANRLPIVVDGFISTAAAMVAASLAPQTCDYMIAAHRSQESGHNLMLEWLKLSPILDLQMRLGEGTGAVLAMMLVEAACKVLTEMATFSEAGVTDKE